MAADEPNGPLGLEPPQGDEQKQNTVNELGHNSEGFEGVGFVSQGFAPELARMNHPRQPEPPTGETARRETLERWSAATDLSEPGTQA